VVAGDVTEGHRFMGSGAPFSVRTFDEYQQKLAADFVILDAAARKQHILNTARAACAARGLELVEDEGLLEEVAGLAEWPTPLIGDMDPAFLDLPPEVIRTSMRTHQKYFAVRRPGESGLAPHFVVVANIEAVDEGEAIRRGNAKVLSARLSDARFFWDEDRKPGAFARWAETLKGVTFHQKLGTMAGRVERITALAEEIAPAVGADPKLTRLAASLCKLDLASQMVGEFPELQGIMGGYYVRRAPFASHAPAAAGSDGEEDPFSGVDQTPLRADAGAWWEGLTRDEIDQVADAVRDHYRPAGPSDSVPTAPVTVAVALADKLDTLVGFFAIGEKPTGSKDPYALRRAALGVIRLVLENKLRMPLVGIGEWRLITEFMRDPDALIDCNYFDPFYGEPSPYLLAYGDRIWRPGVQPPAGVPFLAEMHTTPANEVHAFIIERLKVLLREQGSRHDLIDAGSFSGTDDDLVRIVDRVEALSAFLATEDGANLLAGYKRAVNILRAEAKKDPDEIIAPLPLDAPAPAGLALEEAALLSALTQVSAAMAPRLAAEDFAGAMGELARLRAPVDAFFEGVLVNDPGPEVRRRRLGLLSSLRDAANRVADFSLIQG
jgi:glycyl-tRNA synthetase beta chain